MMRSWVPSSKCGYPCCAMTLCTPIGSEMLCWLHLLLLGLPIDLLDPAPAQR